LIGKQAGLTTPSVPLIEELGDGGEVAPVVRFQMIGEELEPMKQFCPGRGFRGGPWPAVSAPCQIHRGCSSWRT